MNNSIQLKNHGNEITQMYASTVAGGVHGAESLTYLTPEALLAYVETQLRSLDGDIRKRLDGQRDLIGRKELLGKIEAALANGGQNKEAIAEAYKNAIDSLPPGDPLRESLIKGLASTVGGTLDTMAGYVSGQPFDVTDASANLSEADCKSLEASIKSELSDLNNAAELNMIEVQSLMSQRATAIQLGTGMLQKINQSLEMIAKNI